MTRAIAPPIAASLSGAPSATLTCVLWCGPSAAIDDGDSCRGVPASLVKTTVYLAAGLPSPGSHDDHRPASEVDANKAVELT